MINISYSSSLSLDHQMGPGYRYLSWYITSKKKYWYITYLYNNIFTEEEQIKKDTRVRNSIQCKTSDDI